MEYKTSDAARLPFASGTFDVVIDKGLLDPLCELEKVSGGGCPKRSLITLQIDGVSSKRMDVVVEVLASWFAPSIDRARSLASLRLHVGNGWSCLTLVMMSCSKKTIIFALKM